GSGNTRACRAIAAGIQAAATDRAGACVAQKRARQNTPRRIASALGKIGRAARPLNGQGAQSLASPIRPFLTDLRAGTYRINARIARSRPSSVSGYMRPSKRSRIILIDGVQPQWSSGTGLSHTECG